MPSSTITGLPSLSSDVADLLSALTTAFASHPELSEGLKNIVRNASQGAYWAAERDAMVNDALRAAEAAQDNIARAAEHAQEEAGHKVSEALDGVFKALGSILNSTMSQGTDPIQPQSREERPTRETRGRSPSTDPYRNIFMPRSRSHSPHQMEFGTRDNRPGYDDPFSRPCLEPWFPPSLFEQYPHPHHFIPGHPSRVYPGPPPPPPPPPPRRLASPSRHGESIAYVNPWTGAPSPVVQQSLRRTSTLSGLFGPSKIDRHRHDLASFTKSFTNPPPQPGSQALFASSSVRKAELEEAKQHYKAKKEEWRR